MHFFLLGLEDLDQNLGRYPYESLKKWVSLSGFVTESIMTRVQPVCKKISSLTDILPETSPSELLHACEACDTTLRFTPLSFRHFPVGASPAQITKLSMDKSEVLEEIMAKFTG